MTVSNTTRKIRETGNGVKTAFSFPFKIRKAADLTVYKIDTSTSPETLGSALTEGVDYTVATNAVSDGGTVTFTTAPTATEDSFIVRDTDRLQETDLVRVGTFAEPELEGEFDHSRMIDIELEDDIARSLKVPINYTGGDIEFPLPDALKLIRWRADELGFENISLSDISVIEADITLAGGDAGKFVVVNSSEDGYELLARSALVKNSIEVDSNQLQLVNDAASPGNNYFYGTNGSGTKGWYAVGAGAVNEIIQDTDMDTYIDCDTTGADSDDIDFFTGGTERMNLNASGMQLGAANARVTTILDEDTMSSDSATALATQQSIKAYVDAQIASVSSLSFGAWASATVGASTMAAADSIIVIAVDILTGGGWNSSDIVTVKTDAANPPTVIRGKVRFKDDAGPGAGATITVPVKNGDYYLIEDVGSGHTLNAYILPLT